MLFLSLRLLKRLDFQKVHYYLRHHLVNREQQLRILQTDHQENVLKRISFLGSLSFSRLVWPVHKKRQQKVTGLRNFLPQPQPTLLKPTKKSNYSELVPSILATEFVNWVLKYGPLRFLTLCVLFKWFKSLTQPQPSLFAQSGCPQSDKLYAWQPQLSFLHPNSP